MVSIDEFIIVSSNYIPGYEILETKGFVYGLTVRSRGVGGQVGAGIRSMFGGEIKEYVQMMEQSRNEAIERMIQHAEQMGARDTCLRNCCGCTESGMKYQFRDKTRIKNSF